VSISRSQTFAYRAVDTEGTLRTGELNCWSRSAALSLLAKQGLVPVELCEGALPRSDVAKLSFESLWPRRRTIKPRELLSLTQSLAALSNAGLTIDRALQISAMLAEAAVAREVAERLLTGVRSGKTLSHAFAASGQPLPLYYVSMVEAGESSGALPDALGRLAELMRKQLDVRERVRSALVYPSLLAGVVLLTVLMLLTFVLPRFETIFSESEAPLPTSTRIVLTVGRFVADFWWLLLAMVGIAALAAVAWLRSPLGRRTFDGWLLRSRLVLGLPLALACARFLRTLSTLCSNGLPLPAALRAARGTVGNRVLVDALDAVTRAVREGERFSTALARKTMIPPVAVQLARVGEETGRLGEMLASAAAVLEEDSQRLLERLLTLIVPMLTILMGLIVAALIGSVLIGLLSINDLAF
jgi:general secretion pathway protein F